MVAKPMILKNYQEDIVFRTLEITLRENYPKLLGDEKVFNDLAAFVLNRLPPLYVTSSRGMSYLGGPLLNDPDGKTTAHLVSLINLAVKTINERRQKDPENFLAPGRMADADTPFAAFPQIIGSIVDAGTNKPIPGAVVSVVVGTDKKPMTSMEPGWENPSKSNQAGGFCLWPKYLSVEMADAAGLASLEKPQKLTVIIDAPGYKQNVQNIEVETKYYLYPHEVNTATDFFNVGQVQLQK